MRELDKELKELRLYGMAGAWEDLAAYSGERDRRFRPIVTGCTV